MIIIFIILFVIIFFLFILLFKNKSLLVPTICTIFIILFIFNPKTSIGACINGSKLFFFSVFPSIFPFIVFSNMLIAYNGVYFYSKILGPILCKPLKVSKESSLVLIISILCGYPLGAKYCCDLYEKKILSRNDCERLLNIASNPSPLFITGTIGAVLLNNHKAGMILLFSAYASCFIMGIIIPTKGNALSYNNNHTNTYSKNNVESFGKILKESIEESLATCSSIMGFIIIFSVLTEIVKSSIIVNTALSSISSFINIPKNLLFAILIGTIEMTNGCKLVSFSNSSIIIKLVITSFFVCFSGFSIISQVYSFTSKFKFSLKVYIKRKFIQGIICSILSLVISYFVIL